MRDQGHFGFGEIDKGLQSPYEQHNVPMPEQDSLASFDTLASTSDTSPISYEQYPNEVEHMAAVRIFGLGNSLHHKRANRLEQGK